jgi:L-fucose mutarotase
MLIGIPPIISPQLLRILMEMGHGDELVIADANFPAHSIAKSTVYGEAAYCQGTGVAELLDAILTLMPLDYAVNAPVVGMAVPAGVEAPPIHGEFERALAAHGYDANKLCFLPRFDFYDRARRGYAVVASGETARFANLIVKKGVIVRE